MSDSADKTEKPSAQKLSKAKKDGELPRAKEFASACLLFAFCLFFYSNFSSITTSVMNIFKLNFTFTSETLRSNDVMTLRLAKSIFTMIEIFFPFIIVVIIATTAGSLLLGGWVFSLKPLQLKLDKLSPLKGIKRMFSLKSVVELLKSIFKVTFIFLLLYYFLSANIQQLQSFRSLPVESSSVAVLNHLAHYSMYIIGILLLYGLIDLPYQIYEFNKQMKMSKQEVKEEHKQAEGRPEVRQRIRQIQQQTSQRAISKTVPNADVIVMNPTHYAVAIKYDTERAEAPFLVAKGTDEAALLIQRVALENGVEVIISPPLARAIYHTTQLEQMIPNQLFVAIAHVLSYALQLKAFREKKAEKPNNLPNFAMPKGFKF